MKCILEKVKLPDHLAELYEMMILAEDQYLFSARLSFDIDEFEQWLTTSLNGQIFELFLIRTKSGKTAGHIYSYGVSTKDGRCNLAIYIKPKFRGAYGASACLRYVDYMFQTCKYLRVIYAEVYSNNAASLSCCRSGFEEIGVCSGYRYYSGHYHDLHYFVMTREHFYGKFERIIEKCRN